MRNQKGFEYNCCSRSHRADNAEAGTKHEPNKRVPKRGGGVQVPGVLFTFIVQLDSRPFPPIRSDYDRCPLSL